MNSVLSKSSSYRSLFRMAPTDFSGLKHLGRISRASAHYRTFTFIRPIDRDILRTSLMRTDRFSTSILKSCAPCTSESKSSSLIHDEDVPWENLYRFNHIPAVVLLSRAKLLQTIFTFTVIPQLCYVCLYTKTQPISSLQVAIGVSVFAAVMLLVVTRISQRSVMLLYVNP